MGLQATKCATDNTKVKERDTNVKATGPEEVPDVSDNETRLLKEMWDIVRENMPRIGLFTFIK